MPKQVDHAARRTQIAQALLRVAARDGLGSVSLRHVAAEAGVSMGLVQHYFRTKDEMMTFALTVVSENAQARLAAEAPDPEDPPAVIRALLHQMLPLDDERLREAHAALAYAAHTAVRPEAATEIRAQMRQLREYVAAALPRPSDETADGRVAADDSPPPAAPLSSSEAAAATLLALVDGLMLHVLGGVIAPDQARQVLDARLEEAFAPG